MDTTVVYSDASEFEMRGDFMFVTRPAPSSDGEGKSLDLFVSSHGERFVKANLGNEGQDNVDYHIIDVTPEGLHYFSNPLVVLP